MTTAIDETVAGAELYIDIEGKKLFGLACPRHGLRYIAWADMDDLVTAKIVEPVNGARDVVAGMSIVCDICDKILGAPIHHLAVDYTSIHVPLSALEQLQQIAKQKLR